MEALVRLECFLKVRMRASCHVVHSCPFGKMHVLCELTVAVALSCMVAYCMCDIPVAHAWFGTM